MRSGFSAASALRHHAGEDSGSDDRFFRLDVDGAVGALGQSFANCLRGALRPGANDNDFAAQLFPELQTSFERVGVGFVDFPGEIGVLDPRSGRIYFQLAVPRRAPV